MKTQTQNIQSAYRILRGFGLPLKSVKTILNAVSPFAAQHHFWLSFWTAGVVFGLPNAWQEMMEQTNKLRPVLAPEHQTTVFNG
jgi:hypothetical protein